MHRLVVLTALCEIGIGATAFTLHVRHIVRKSLQVRHLSYDVAGCGLRRQNVHNNLPRSNAAMPVGSGGVGATIWRRYTSTSSVGSVRSWAQASNGRKVSSESSACAAPKFAGWAMIN